MTPVTDESNLRFQTFFQQELDGIPRHICAFASQMSRVLGVDVKTVALLQINQCVRDAEALQVID
jgi:hypothetical protein